MGRLGDIADVAMVALLAGGGYLIYKAVTGFKLELPQLELGPTLLPYIEHPPWDEALEGQVTELGTGIMDLQAQLEAQAAAIQAQQARIDAARAGLPTLAAEEDLGWHPSEPAPVSTWVQEPLVDIMALAASLSKPGVYTPMGPSYEVL